ncbi:2-amino-4-hydroxy-6-hydroxymethyldihydropteridine diphosphokinase [Rhodobacteraceae bacterium CCMM004]|nr:2-amino-4-hydroxy-6-hydroxymethyldihydropteridine diphosphokinase [Rhodobacteraceae bacterium CCMM004]
MAQYRTEPVPPREVFIALGGNATIQGTTLTEVLNSAVTALDCADLRLVAASRLYRTPAFPAGSGPDYVNGAARFATTVSPQAVLDRLHEVEARFWRRRDQRWGARTLDLDLLAVGDAVIPDRATYDRWRALPPDRQAAEAPDRLILPHPRMQDRAFVLVPLAEIAPDWTHPVDGRTPGQMLAALPEDATEGIRPLP